MTPVLNDETQFLAWGEKLCPKCKLSKALPDFHRNASKKDGLATWCRLCANGAVARWGKRNAARRAVTNHRWSAANKARRALSGAAWRKANPAIHAEKNRRWKALHPGAAKAATRGWEARNPGKHRAYKRAADAERYVLKASSYKARARERDMRMRQASPAWRSKELIEAAYRLATARTRDTGRVWHVDHVVPLHSPLVCGLHTEANLQVIPGRENLAKGNRYWPDMP